MTITSTVPTTHRSSGGGPLSGALAFEWTKLATVRGTWWGLGSSVLLTAGTSAILGLSASASAANDVDVAQPAPHLAALALALAQLAMVAVAALAVTSEFSSGTIQTTLQAVPVRGRALFAKTAVIAVVGFATGVVLSAIGTAVVAPLMGEPGRFTAEQAVFTALGTGTYFALLSIITVGLGTALRSAAGTITTLVLLLLAVPQILQVIGLDWVQRVGDAMPSVAGLVLMTQESDPYGVGTAVAVLSGWALAAAATGYLALRTRD